MLLYWLDVLGIAVFAVSGCLAAGRKHLDWLGVFVIALVTAVGGGTLRDLLLARHPIYWIRDANYLYAIGCAVAVTLVYTRFCPPPEQALLIADALGLSVYSIVGTQLAENAGVSGIVAILMGTISATCGGVIRDILCNEIPFLLRGRYLYATAAIVGSSIYVLLENWFLRELAGAVGMAVVGVLRCASIIYEWNLPVFRLEEQSNAKKEE